MARHHEKQHEPCPVARSVNLVGDRWSLLLLRDAFDGSRRFSDFQRGLGIARSILTDRLRNLVNAGIFEVRPASDGTAYQEYVLTMKGETLFPVVVALRQWGTAFVRTRRAALTSYRYSVWQTIASDATAHSG